MKTNLPRNAGLLEPIQTKKPFEIVAMDIMGPVTKSPEGYQYILNCVDLYTSWPESIALKSLTAIELIEAVHKIILSRHGCPTTILTDQGTNFMSKLFEAMCRNYGINHKISTAYHHKTIGKVERFHKYMQNSLSTVVKADQSNWPKYIDSCLFAYRTTYNRSLKEIPFFLLYGRDPKMPQDAFDNNCERYKRELKAENLDIYKTKLLKTLKRLHILLDEHKENYQDRYKQYYDRNKRHVSYEVGDKVRIYFPNREDEGLSYKLGTRWRGPYQIVERLDTVTYRVRQEKA